MFAFLFLVQWLAGIAGVHAVALHVDRIKPRDSSTCVAPASPRRGHHQLPDLPDHHRQRDGS